MKLLDYSQRYKKVLGELTKNIISFSLLIIVQQILALPIISRFYDINTFGKIVLAFGIINIITSMFGFSIGNARLLDNNFYNYKYLLLLNFSNILTIFISLLVYFLIFPFDFLDSIFYALICVLGNLRFFFISEYRIKDEHNNILRQNLYYFMGILLGLIGFIFIKNWLIIFLTAELVTVILAYIYHFYKKRFFKLFVDKKHLKFTNSYQLMFNNGFSYSLNQYERFIIYPILGAHNVSLYYATSISARVGGLILNPLSNFILGKISNNKMDFNRKNINIIISVSTLFIIFFFIFNLILTPILIKILYPSFLSMINFLIVPVCAEAAVMGGILILKPIMMRYKGVKYYNKLFIIYGLTVILLSIIFCIKFGLIGVALAKFISSLVLFLVSMLGLKVIKLY